MDSKRPASLHDAPLGKTSAYPSQYDPQLLFPLDRQEKRSEIGIARDRLPFIGVDRWTAFEVSWLNSKGKPMVAIIEFDVPIESRHICESKSVKLYLNSFNQARFESPQAVLECIRQDLSNACGSPVSVRLYSLRDYAKLPLTEFNAIQLDDLDVSCDHYDYAPQLLNDSIVSTDITHQQWSTELFKSNCLITSQPDWASVFIECRGPTIRAESLLQYLVSFRTHNEFHEQCVERIFVDLIAAWNPQSLSVYARFTRRGGVDINPWRSTDVAGPMSLRAVRQ